MGEVWYAQKRTEKEQRIEGLFGEEAVAMELYRVLLVDDEEAIRTGISQKMDWQKLGFSLAGEASNGRDALELAEVLLPDVVLTDIKMPFLDGLGLCGSLEEFLPSSKFVIFSGFDDFEYAKQAIQRNVSEYILKPINAEELGAVLKRLKAELDRERTERRDMETLQSRYAQSLPVLRELFYTQLLEGRIPQGTEREQAARLDMDLSGSVWTVALAHMGGAQGRHGRSFPSEAAGGESSPGKLQGIPVQRRDCNPCGSDKKPYHLRPDPDAGQDMHPSGNLSEPDIDGGRRRNLPAAFRPGPVCRRGPGGAGIPLHSGAGAGHIYRGSGAGQRTDALL